jgi:hypothetical protein
MRLTRRSALASAGYGVAGTAVGAPALAAGDREEQARAALTRVLKLEQTAVVGYEAIANAGIVTDTLRTFLEQERQHADQLVAALESLGAKPPIPPRRTAIRFLPSALNSRGGALLFAKYLELRAIPAYQDAIRTVHDPALIRILAGAMGTDAQQLVVIRELEGFKPVMRAFEKGLR